MDTIQSLLRTHNDITLLSIDCTPPQHGALWSPPAKVQFNEMCDVGRLSRAAGSIGHMSECVDHTATPGGMKNTFNINEKQTRVTLLTCLCAVFRRWKINSCSSVTHGLNHCLFNLMTVCTNDRAVQLNQINTVDHLSCT